MDSFFTAHVTYQDAEIYYSGETLYEDYCESAALIPDTITIEAVELIYRTGNEERCYMPYYRFFIPIHNQSNGEMQRHYGAFYVPAVEPQYLDMQ